MDIRAINAVVARCVTVTAGDGPAIRFAALPGPKVDPAQVGAVRTTLTADGSFFKTTYIAQVNDYTVTAYATCAKVPVCEKELTPVFRNGIAKAKKA